MSTLLDGDTIVLEGLDFDLPCVEGPHAAELLVSCRYCPQHAFWCREHWLVKRRRGDDFLAGSRGALIECSSCHSVSDTIDGLMRVVTL